MAKFITPVSMVVPDKELMLSLHESLLQLGYKKSEKNYPSNDWNLLVTNYWEHEYKENDLYGVLDIFSRNDYGRYFIDHYNPELFLVLAGMTDDKEIKVGEWVRARKSYTDKMSVFKVTEENYCEYYPKATKEQLIKHFQDKRTFASGGFIPFDKLMNDYQKFVQSDSDYLRKISEQLSRQMRKAIKSALGATNDNPVFKKDDRVFNHSFGWGIVMETNTNFVHVKLDMNCSTWIDNKSLSFTEYNLVTGGFNQKRPQEKPKVGEVYFVQDIRDQWHVGYIYQIQMVRESASDPGTKTVLIASTWPECDIKDQWEYKQVTKENPFK